MFIFPSPTAWWPVGPNQLAWIKLKKLDGCIVWNAHNAVFGSKRSAFCAQAVYFLHSTRPSVTWRNRRWRLAACDWVMSALPAVLSTRVRRRRKFWKVSCVEFTFQRNDFELIPTVEIGTKNPTDGYFSSEFPSICNHCGDTAAWSRKTLKCLKSVKSCVAYLTKKLHFVWLSSCRYCADSAQNLPGPAPDNVLRVLQISSKSIHFRRSYSRTCEHRQNAL